MDKKDVKYMETNEVVYKLYKPWREKIVKLLESGIKYDDIYKKHTKNAYELVWYWSLFYDVNCNYEDLIGLTEDEFETLKFRLLETINNTNNHIDTIWIRNFKQTDENDGFFGFLVWGDDQEILYRVQSGQCTLVRQVNINM